SGYLFAAGVAVWYTLLVLPLAAGRETLQKLQQLTHRPVPVRMGRLVYRAVLCLVCVELSLRGYGVLRDHVNPVVAGLTSIGNQARASTAEAGLFHVTLAGNPAA